MDEIEVPMEKVQEDIHHQIHHSDQSSGFMMKGALLSAILAVLAAIGALNAGKHANEAMIDQLSASDSWAYYQAKGIKASITEIKLALNAENTEATKQKIEEYKKQQEETKLEAEKKQNESREHLRKHEALASSVTFFQIAIALTAISVLTKKRRFMSLSLVLGIVGIIMMVRGFFFV